MTTHEKALEAARYAYAETVSRGVGFEYDDAALEDAIAAYLSAILPEDAEGLVESLSMSMFANADHMLERMHSDRTKSASLIQSQAARIAELEAGLLVARKWMPVGHRNGLTVTENMERDAVDALLNGERKG